MDPRWRQLHDLAMRQHGHVATRQVEEARLTRPALHYQVRAGLLEPVALGVSLHDPCRTDGGAVEGTAFLYCSLDGVPAPEPSRPIPCGDDRGDLVA